ncbi:subtilisin-like protease [Andrographis paniculata]|uniref:subtilisin-like protease n=1 Tax=Andrographis paniculata TaxID=175694 RepID=UPI0021E79865|nr:subtilisin-like protease [Andrographis paniculata]
MAGYNACFLTLLYLTSTTFHLLATSDDLHTYIIHVEIPGAGAGDGAALSSTLADDDLPTWYQNFLPKTPLSSADSTQSPPSILYSYRHVFKGFAARLSPGQAKAMETVPGFISAAPEKKLPLHSTHSLNFLGLNINTAVWNDSNYGRGIIIGLLDSGITPGHPSFNDDGIPPPPPRWRGACEFAAPQLCNNKLIGARSYAGGGTPADEIGHGTHTASTAAGSFVRGANVFGNGNGTAAGVAPMAHIASYKVCDVLCSESDILAGMDAAIGDGVDVISLSLGGPARNFYSESVAVGAFSAIEKGIFVSASAGNSGPALGTVENGAPWILTVGAGNIDRKIRATAVLGNNETFFGESTFQPANFPATQHPLFFAGSNSTNNNASFCLPGALRAVPGLRGKIVICLIGGGVGRIAKGREVKNAGGAGMILINRQPQGYTTYSDSHVLRATHLTYADGQKLLSYLNSTSEPTAAITYQGTIIGDNRAPELAQFSGRGPSQASPGILKPDIIGPGHNILAAWHISVENNTNTTSNFNIISGTSMSCPHLSGIAALLKSIHPKWSPAAIKSAIMTTATQVNLAGAPIEDETRRPANLFGLGAGHVNILRATNPGLVYDLRSEDYIPYLCGLGYTDQQVGIVVNRPIRCAEIASVSEEELNYPSFSIALGSVAQTYNRTVTNVGEANSTYTVRVTGLPRMDVAVEPTSLRFVAANERITYRVSFRRGVNATSNAVSQGFITWSSSTLKYVVRSPVVVLLR